jgi:hypothetical protein
VFVVVFVVVFMLSPLGCPTDRRVNVGSPSPSPHNGQLHPTDLTRFLVGSSKRLGSIANLLGNHHAEWSDQPEISD